MPRPPLPLLPLLALDVLCAGLSLAGACERASHAATESAPPPATKPAEAPAPAAVPCTLDVTQPGPLRRAGRARIQLKGSALGVDTEVPALCGPLFNRDVDALGIKAGEGLLFEACVPEGYLQITSRARTAGAQHMHDGEGTAGSADVSFNVVGGATYSSRGVASDHLTLSDDLWKADADLTLRDVADSGDLAAHIRFDCSEPKKP